MRNKRVLIVCMRNSCRSIIAEAIINTKLKSIEALSYDITPSGKINLNAIKVLKLNNLWDNKYFSKHSDKVININFDLVKTVFDNVNETCPIFSKNTKVIHIGFKDLDDKEFNFFVNTYNEIEKVLLPKIKDELSI
jgi:arsenate reductase